MTSSSKVLVAKPTQRPWKIFWRWFCISKQVDKMGKRFRKGEKDGREGCGGGGGGRLNEEELKALANRTSFSLANVKDFHEVKCYKYLFRTQGRSLPCLVIRSVRHSVLLLNYLILFISRNLSKSHLFLCFPNIKRYIISGVDRAWEVNTC